jgi:hypothetical protein
MKQFVIFVSWAFTLMWAGNFVTFYVGVPTIVTAPAAIGFSLLIAIGPARVLATVAANRNHVSQAALARVERAPQA